MKIVIAAGLLLATAWAHAQEVPPAGYESAGICPFECCTYRDWTADADIPVHASRSERAPVLFRLRRGETLRALTGVVVTDKPGVVKVTRPLQGGTLVDGSGPALSLQPGDVVYRLAPLGEGVYRFWYRGKVYQSSEDMLPMPTVREAEITWWKQVRNRRGQTGWTRSDRFTGADACG